MMLSFLFGIFCGSFIVCAIAVISYEKSGEWRDDEDDRTI